MELLERYKDNLYNAERFLKQAPDDCTNYAFTEGVSCFHEAINDMQSICSLCSDYKKSYSAFLLLIIDAIKTKE